METTVLKKQGTGQQNEVLKSWTYKMCVDAGFWETGNYLVRNLEAFSSNELSLIMYK
jgi:hypothetical protein